MYAENAALASGVPIMPAPQNAAAAAMIVAKVVVVLTGVSFGQVSTEG
jgi:hypothetical protein